MRAGMVHRRIFWTADGVAGRRQRSRQILDPAARALSFLVRRPSDVVQVDRRESLDRVVQLVGERSRDVLEAAAIRLVIEHDTILAAPRALQCVNNAAAASAGSQSTDSTRRSMSPGCSHSAATPRDVRRLAGLSASEEAARGHLRRREGCAAKATSPRAAG
jgi:hypothetical protein